MNCKNHVAELPEDTVPFNLNGYAAVKTDGEYKMLVLREYME